jgi:hypothetical protein
MAAAQQARGVQEKIIDFIDISAALAEKAGEVLGQREAFEKEAQDLIPTAVEELLKARLIEPEEKQAAVQALRDPVRTLQILIKTARARQADNAIVLGQPAGKSEKRASASPYAGRRYGEHEEPESHRVFRERLMGGN